MEAIEKAFRDVEAPGKDADEAKPADTPAEGARPRGPDGKFVAKDGAQPADVARPDAPSADRAPLGEPPARFSADAKAAWNDAPDAVKGEIKRAIGEMERGLAQKDEQLAPLKPYFDLASQHGVEMHEVLGNYVAMEQLLARDMRQGLTAIARNFGMTLEDMLGHVTGQAARNPAENDKDRQIVTLVQKIEQLEQRLGGVSQNVEQQRRQGVQAEIDAFEQANPRFH
ncbi:MAG: hypothetical protein AAF982_06315, partial [Pseudomonadota bacterium]